MIFHIRLCDEMDERKKRRRLRRVEDATVLDISELRRWGWLVVGIHERDWYPHGAHDSRRGSLRLAIDDAHAELNVSFAGNHTIKLESDTPPFGGRRWWLVCPLTGRRARKVFLFRDEREFLCREAVNPPFSFPSQRTSGLNRALQRRDAVALKLRSGHLLESGKPRGMRWKTYLRYLAKERRLETQVTALILGKILPADD